MTLEGTPVPLRTARVSAMPFNRRWPGRQRSIDQTELAPFASFETDGPVRVELCYPSLPKEVVVKPLSRGVTPETDGCRVAFTLPGSGQYTVESDGWHEALHIFADPVKTYEVDVDDPNVIYFGKGVHDAGTIRLHSGQTLYIDEGAVVYATVRAYEAHDIRILGRGILDNSRNKEKILYDVDCADGSFAVLNAEREHFIQLEYCDGILIDGVTLRDSLVYNIRLVCCTNARIENVKIIGNWRYNSDGIDMHNCASVTIRGCFIRTYDDSICVKGFDYAQDEKDMVHNGRAYLVFDDVLVEGCVIWCDWGRALEIGAETRAKEIMNIHFRNIDIIRSSSVMMDVQNVDYADVHHITFENIRAEYDRVTQAPTIQTSDAHAFVDDPNSAYMPALMCSCVYYQPEYSAGGQIRGRNRGILFKDIEVFADRMPPSSFTGFDAAHQSSNIRIENLRRNGKPVASLDEARVTVGEFASGVTIA